MEVNNNPALSLLPAILGDRSNQQIRPAERVEVERTSDRADGSGQQLTRVVSETERQAAQQQLNQQQDQRNTQADNPNLFREPLSANTNRAINTYLQNEQDMQLRELSNVLGIDVYS